MPFAPPPSTPRSRTLANRATLRSRQRSALRRFPVHWKDGRGCVYSFMEATRTCQHASRCLLRAIQHWLSDTKKTLGVYASHTLCGVVRA